MEGGGSREALLGFLRLKCVKYVAPYPNVFSHILLNTLFAFQDSPSPQGVNSEPQNL